VLHTLVHAARKCWGWRNAIGAGQAAGLVGSIVRPFIGAAVSWEKQLLEDTPRGLDGGEDRVSAARWAQPEELGEEWAYRRSSIFLGYRDGRGIGCGDDRHLMLVAGSRAGKGVSFVIPNLLLYEGSVLAIDPKGELANVTAERRAGGLGQDVHVIDPFGASGPKTAAYRSGFNPLAEIAPASPTALDDAALLADALIVDDGGGDDKHWTNAARDLVKGLILFALLKPAPSRHLGEVRSFFRAPGEFVEGKPVNGQIRYLLEMQRNEGAFDGALAGIASALLGKNERELNSIVSSADVQLGFLDSRPLMDCLKESRFRLADLKRAKTTVYLCLPASRMSTHAKWFRMIVTMTMLMCERVELKPNPPLLMLLEEFPVLGHMRPIEVAAGQIAGLGVKIWAVLQDLTQLQRHYGQSWETFMGNSGATIFFGNADNTTLEYVSKKLGTIGFDLRRRSSAAPSARLGGAKPIEEQLQHSRLLEPHEVELMFARQQTRALVLYPGQHPLVVRRVIYHDDPHFEGMF
jgi:type IV secretion system protein VirD4